MRDRVPRYADGGGGGRGELMLAAMRPAEPP